MRNWGFFGLYFIAAVLLGPWPALAYTAMSFSMADNTYGWCTRSNDQDAASCAVKQCVASGGAACQLVTQCHGGFGAVAFAETPALGIGMTCGINSAFSARTIAIGICSEAAHALCWTDSAFDSDGNEFSSAQNATFDLLWYIQDMLQLRDYGVTVSDGNPGPQTTAAIQAFQTDLGIPATGQADGDVLDRLIYAVGGVEQLLLAIKESSVDPRREEVATVSYAAAARPNPRQTFTQEMLALSDARRLIALATIVRTADMACTTPAKVASPIGDSESSFWHVECNEGSYVVIVNDDGSRVVSSE